MVQELQVLQPGPWRPTPTEGSGIISRKTTKNCAPVNVRWLLFQRFLGGPGLGKLGRLGRMGIVKQILISADLIDGEQIYKHVKRRLRAQRPRKEGKSRLTKSAAGEASLLDQ